jgi:electron transport complex protein RnfC
MGGNMMSVVIENDFQGTISEEVKVPADPDALSVDEMVEIVKQAGIVGMGGATFPTHVKISGGIGKVDTVLINGAECEPYITSDTRTMIDDADAVADGIALVKRFLEVPSIVIGIEKNKPECIASMKKAVAGIDGATVKALPSVYPQGGEKVLVYHTLGRVIKEGGLPLDCGVVVMNCTTIANISKFIRTGMPLVEKCVTVDGSAIKEPKNVIAPIGTAARALVEFCGGFAEEPRKALYGGPMMGIALTDLSAPVLKQTNALLVFGEKEATPPPVTPCIKCGRCIDHCPFGLDPTAISKAYKANDPETLEKLKVNLCMECGCCSYVCPAKRNIVQRNKMAKTMLRNFQMERKKREEAQKNG